MFKKALFAFSLLAMASCPVLAKPDLMLKIPNLGVVEGKRLLLETFDLPDAWETYSNPGGVELGVENGVYRAYTMNDGYAWGLNHQAHTDVILEVEATPLTIHYENGFGVMCRADETNNGDGYYFMINASGYYSIRKGQGNAVLPLVEWQPSNAIHQELDRNLIRAVCMGDHLALYVNDQLLAEVEDDSYRTGYAGLSVASDGSDADVAFDNLVIYEASEGQ